MRRCSIPSRRVMTSSAASSPLVWTAAGSGLAWRRPRCRKTPWCWTWACGTGDFSRLVLERLPRANSYCSGYYRRMLQLAHASGLNDAVCSDAADLPFADNSFDCVFIGYGLRNCPDVKKAIREIQRVTKPGGSMVNIDFFLPSNLILRRIYLGFCLLKEPCGTATSRASACVHLSSGFAEEFSYHAAVHRVVGRIRVFHP